jgi:hypothetical protein
METYVLMMFLLKDPNTHALGPFASRESCVAWMTMFNKARYEGMGTCMTMAQFRRERPDMRLEDLGT